VRTAPSRPGGGNDHLFEVIDVLDASDLPDCHAAAAVDAPAGHSRGAALPGQVLEPYTGFLCGVDAKRPASRQP